MTGRDVWTVRDEIGVFKGGEFYAMTPTREKAVELARWLNWADMADGSTAWLSGLSIGQLRVVRHSVRVELERRGVGEAGRQAEGGAGGDPAAVDVVAGPGVGAVGAGDRGDCPPQCDGSGAGQ